MGWGERWVLFQREIIKCGVILFLVQPEWKLENSDFNPKTKKNKTKRAGQIQMYILVYPVIISFRYVGPYYL